MVEPFLSRVWDLHKALRLISVLCAVSAGTAPAWAGAILQLQIGSGGTVSYGRGIRQAGLQGNDIRIRQLNYGVAIIPILLGHLFFHGQGFASSQEGRLLWGPGGSLVVRGCADLNADAKCDRGDIRGTLLTATFVNVQLIQKGSQAILIAQILDQINPQLAARLGLPVTTLRGQLKLLLLQSGCCRGRVRDLVQSGFLDASFAVPEPSSIVFLGAGFIGLIFGGRIAARRL